MHSRLTPQTRPVQILAGTALLDGDLTVPERALGLVIFAHGSGSSRFSSRNRAVSQMLTDGRFATLLLDLLTSDEDAIDLRTREYRFDVDRLGHRVVSAVDWARGESDVAALPIACFGASTGAAAALIAAAHRPDSVRAVVSRGGRPDLAADALPRVHAPTLLIVGGSDEVVMELNRAAMQGMRAHVVLEIVPGATHLFEEPGALDRVSQLALAWCQRYLSSPEP
jgi:putative phosphoribosyl transferase